VADLKSEYHQRSREKAERQHRQAECERQEAVGQAERERHEAAVQRVVQSINQLSVKLDQKFDENAPGNARERRLRRVEVTGLWAAAVVSLAALVVAVAAMLVARGQLEAMQADQRAWLKVEFEILKPFVFDDHGLQLAFSAKTSNIGKSPAFDVQLYPIITANVADAVRMQKELCDQKRPANEKPVGVVVFPNGSVTNDPVTSGFSWDEINKNKTMMRFSIPPKNDLLGIVVTGCINYALAGEKNARHHQTGFGFFLKQRQIEIRGFEAIKGTSIPIADINYEMWPELTWAD
jgi:hypothetical protein